MVVMYQVGAGIDLSTAAECLWDSGQRNNGASERIPNGLWKRWANKGSAQTTWAAANRISLTPNPSRVIILVQLDRRSFLVVIFTYTEKWLLVIWSMITDVK
jgi:hypothetical protein